MLYVEYLMNELATHHFQEMMTNYIWLKTTVQDWTGYKHDLKLVNPNFGKKKAFKKS